MEVGLVILSSSNTQKLLTSKSLIKIFGHSSSLLNIFLDRLSSQKLTLKQISPIWTLDLNQYKIKKRAIYAV